MRAGIKPKERQLWSLQSGWNILLMIGIIFFLYSFSIGPSYRLLRKQSISQKTFNAFYFPILRPAMQSKFLNDLLMQYLLLWYSDFEELGKKLEELRKESEATNSP